MAVREFNGTSDQLILDNGALGAINNSLAFSIVALIEPTSIPAADRGIVSICNATTGLMSLYSHGSASGSVFWGGDDPAADTGANVGLAASVWNVIGLSKAAGSATVRVHRKQLGTGAWTHADAGSVGTSATAATRILVGTFPDGTGFMPMRLALVATFQANLTDTDFTNIESNATTAWILSNLSPTMLAEFNQASTGTSVTDLTGGGADQTALTGTTAVTGNDPAWTFGAAGSATGSSTFPITVTVDSAGTGIQILSPSADSADGNWTTDSGGTALAAAIDETSASDSDYIRSEFGPSSSGCRVKLASSSDPTSSAGHIIRWRTGKNLTGGATINMTVKLMQGGANTLGAGTQIASFNRNNVDALTTYAETLSGGEADAITDYSDLYLEFYANQA